jgi:hypothetical protein
VSQLVTRRDTQKGTIVEKVINLAKLGLSAREIAEEVYGDGSYKYRQRVWNILYLYGKRLGMLDYTRVTDDYRGEVIDPESGLVLAEREIGESFIPHSKPVSPNAPFLGAYYSMRQLKASLSRDKVREVEVMSWVDKFLGPLGYGHDSLVRADAMLIARRNAGLGSPKLIGHASAIASVLVHRPSDFSRFISYAGESKLDKVIYILPHLEMPEKYRRVMTANLLKILFAFKSLVDLVLPDGFKGKLIDAFLRVAITYG